MTCELLREYNLLNESCSILFFNVKLAEEVWNLECQVRVRVLSADEWS